jgi:hypothetical protein
VHFVLSAGVLGGAFMGQFLGHWYLNVPGMNIYELKKVSRLFILALSLKIIENLVLVVQKIKETSIAPSFFDDMGRPLGLDISQSQSWIQLNLEHSPLGLKGDYFLGLGGFGILVYSMRVLWGLLAPVIMALMVHKTISIRATQSATGILYATCVLVLLGEGAAIFLFLKLGWFL